MKNILAKTDWKLLHNQKLLLIGILQNTRHAKKYDALFELIDFLDALENTEKYNKLQANTRE